MRGAEPREPDAGNGRGRSGRFFQSRIDLVSDLPRKEVIQPHVPVRLPCYDSGADDSGGVTGGVYKARERIHRGVLIRDY